MNFIIRTEDDSISIAIAINIDIIGKNFFNKKREIFFCKYIYKKNFLIASLGKLEQEQRVRERSLHKHNHTNTTTSHDSLEYVRRNDNECAQVKGGRVNTFNIRIFHLDSFRIFDSHFIIIRFVSIERREKNTHTQHNP